MCHYLFSPMMWLFGRNAFVAAYTNEIVRYTSKTDRLTFMTHNDSLVRKYWVTKADLSKSITLNFCGLDVPASANYEEVLRRIYGDYMKYPPAEERGRWHEDWIIFDPDVPYKEFLRKALP